MADADNDKLVVDLFNELLRRGWIVKPDVDDIESLYAAMRGVVNQYVEASVPAPRYAPTMRRGGCTRAPAGYGVRKWHQDATADTHAAYDPVGRVYVVQCAWCPAVFIGLTKPEAFKLFAEHEADMRDEGHAN